MKLHIPLIKRKKDKLAFLSLALIFAFIVFWTYQFYLLFFTNKDDFLLHGIDAFLGAFLAFLFIRVGDFLTKLNQREIKHFNSLITLGTELNEALTIANDNLYLIKPFRETIIGGHISWNRLHPIPINKNHLEELFDVDLINKLFTNYYDARRLNDDMEGLQKGYDELKAAYIDKKIKLLDYIDNTKRIAKQMKNIEIFLTIYVEDTKLLYAQVRLQQYKDKPLSAKLMEIIIQTSGSKNYKTRNK